MKRRTRALAGFLLAAALFAGVPSPAVLAQETEPPPEGGSGADNAVVAINTQDYRELFRVHLQITRATGEVVDAGNAAVAFSSCVSCETVAAAYQVVLIFSTPQVVITENIAFAFNLNCDSCVSVAYAYQGVFTTGGPVHFTPEGNQALAQIRQDLNDLRRADLDLADPLDLAELVAALESIAVRLEEIVRTQLVSSGPTTGTEEPDPAPTSGTGSEPSPEATVEESPSPSPSPTASPEPSPSG